MGRRRLSLNAFQWSCAVWLAALVLVAAAAPLLAPWDPLRQDLELSKAPPGSPGHALGTDDLGRDQLSRLIYGSRAALAVGLATVAVSAGVGLAVGLAAGLGGRRLDAALMLLMDALLSVPTVLLAIAVVAFMGYGLPQIMLALGVVYSPVFARLARTETLALKGEPFVEASAVLGSRLAKTVRLHILPNIAGPVVTQAALTFAMAVVVESSLSYLGLGVQPPEASWGLMLREGRNFMIQAPWLSLFPGLAIALTVLACNVLGDWLARRFDPTSP